MDYEAIAKVLNDESPNPSSGYGIRNIHQRLQLHYGLEYGLTYAKRPGGGTMVTVRLRVIRQSD